MAHTLRSVLVLALTGASLAIGLGAPASAGPDPGGPDVSVARVDARTRAILREDPTAAVDERGRLYFTDPTVAAPAAVPPVTRAPYAYGDTFLLHSKPGSTHTIFLDFDGTDVSDTAWNTGPTPLANGFVPGWDLSGDGATVFSNAEQDIVQSVWQRVAEDYAPFDVDVTTQDPGEAALDRTGNADQTFGTRVVVTSNDNAWAKVCNRQCGGVAYVDVFDAVGSEHAFLQPAWVFPAGTGNNAKGITEALTHEVGHTMGLSHDGNGLNPDYDDGHGSWAPIMGAGYYRPITQWSKGDYSGANNPEDDVAIIASSTGGYRADEAGSTPATASSLVSGNAAGYITTRADTDVFALGTCAGGVTLTATPAPTSPDLDISLALLDASGAVVAVNDPPSSMTSIDVAAGLGASINQSVAAGLYFVRVDGVGAGTPTASYDDYASLGAYSVSTTGCTNVSVTAPTAPTSVSASRDTTAGTATITWQPPASDGGSTIIGYEVRLDSGAWVARSASDRSHTFAAISTGSHTLTVRALNATGAGPEAQTNVAKSATAPSAVTDLVSTLDAAKAKAFVSWQPPSDDGGSAITGYQVQVGTQVSSFGPTVRGISIAGLPRGSTVTVIVRAVNAVGTGAFASTTVTAPVLAPSAPTIGKAGSGKKGGKITATVRWRAPSTANGAQVNGYQVYAYLLRANGRVEATYTSSVLAPNARSLAARLPKAGRYRFAVRARNSAGWSKLSARSGTVTAR